MWKWYDPHFRPLSSSAFHSWKRRSENNRFDSVLTNNGFHWKLDNDDFFCSGDQAATRGFNTSADKISQALIQFLQLPGEDRDWEEGKERKENKSSDDPALCDWKNVNKIAPRWKRANLKGKFVVSLRIASLENLNGNERTKWM